MANKRLWVEFNALLAVLIYGLVIFPDVEKLVDLAAICVFMNPNPVPTILANTYFVIHSRYGKKGVVVSCMPLFYKWFMYQLLTKRSFVDTHDARTWAPKLMALTSFDITWYM